MLLVRTETEFSLKFQILTSVRPEREKEELKESPHVSSSLRRSQGIYFDFVGHGRRQVVRMQ